MKNTPKARQQQAQAELFENVCLLQQVSSSSVPCIMATVLNRCDRWMLPWQKYALGAFLERTLHEQRARAKSDIDTLDQYHEKLRQGLLQLCREAWVDREITTLQIPDCYQAPQADC
jgi:hypothetical protein